VILGIDEAGRGPVIGPMVLCGVWLRSASEEQLDALGVQDSKAFGSSATARQRREELAAAIRQLCDGVTVLVVDAGEVDRWVSQGRLNHLERELARVIIDSGPTADAIIADGATLFSPLQSRYPQLQARNKADASVPVVAAASIVAKDERDRCFSALVAPHEQTLGPIRGGGYANKGTEAFVRRHVEATGELPQGVRRSWSWAVLEELGFPLLRQQLSLPGHLWGRRRQ
jgi:ribonuclease HII